MVKEIKNTMLPEETIVSSCPTRSMRAHCGRVGCRVKAEDRIEGHRSLTSDGHLCVRDPLHPDHNKYFSSKCVD